MAFLGQIKGPADLKRLSRAELVQLAAEIREFLIANVSRTGGHLGPNLGVVELTIALHRVFHSPLDPIIFDTGHQSYVHKILTGRQGQFPTLRQNGGLSGYPSRAESEHDWVENSHASASLAWAEGIARGFKLSGNPHHVVAVIGDGALTGGMAWEALNTIAEQDDLRLVIVVNDNGRSYRPTVGGLSKQLSGMRTDPRYEQTLELVKRIVSGAPLVGRGAYDLLHGLKVGLKDVLAPQSMFSDLGLKYLGPIDGHDLAAVERTLEQACAYEGPVLVHCLTGKGHGFKAAEDHVDDQFHAVGRINELTGEPLSSQVADTWTDAFADAMLRLGGSHSELVAITAAMLLPVGLGRFAAAYPERCFDVGIAEQHAVATAAGLASVGYHPVVAVYSTFLNRAFDQVLMDVAMHRLGVTFALDRSGITGPDGASHHGMWDVSILNLVPGLRLAAPRDEQRLNEALDLAIGVTDGPTVVRYSKEAVPDPIPAVRSIDGIDVLRDSRSAEVLVIGYGQFAGLALATASALEQQGINAMVVDPLWGLPVNPALLELAAGHKLVVSVEDNLVIGGLGSRLSQELRAAGIDVPTREFGVPQQFLHHASRGELLTECGLTAHDLARQITESYLRLSTEAELAGERP